MIDKKINIFSAGALEWLEQAPFNNVKEASQAARALWRWEWDAGRQISWLGHARSGAYWNSENSARDTARACYALLECGKSCKSSLSWLMSVQSADGSWNNDVYDTSYALIALGYAGQANQKGVQWLLDGTSEEWKHPGTIALINSALIYQGPEGLDEVISNNASWLLDCCKSGHWKYIVTTCLAVQSLIMAGKWDYRGESVEWLLDGIGKGRWKISEVSQVLITFKMYQMHNRKPL